MLNKLIKFTGGSILSCDDRKMHELLINNSIIQDPLKLFYEKKQIPDIVIDCTDFIICPGFIETQINGCCGYDFSDSNTSIFEAIKHMSKWITSQGVVAFCPTIVSSTPEYYKKKLFSQNFENLSLKGANFLGFHLEGPFINPIKRGAHDIEAVHYFLGIDSSYISHVYGCNLGSVKMITLDPDISGSLDVIKELQKQDIKVSIGHTDASYEKFMIAFEYGASCLTHTFNQMTEINHRLPGILTVLLENKSTYYGVICDGLHVHPSLICIMHKINPTKMILVTDATPGIGLKDNCMFHIGKVSTSIEHGIAYIRGTSVLAGSMAKMNECIRNLIAYTSCDIELAIKTATINPARFLGVDDHYGTLEPGKNASFVIMDKTFNIHATFVDGNLKYLKGDSSLFKFLNLLYDRNELMEREN